MANKKKSMTAPEQEQISELRQLLEKNNKIIYLQTFFIYMFTWIPNLFIPKFQNPQLHSITHFLINWIVAAVLVFLGIRIRKKSKEYLQLSREKNVDGDSTMLFTQHYIYFAVAVVLVGFSFYYLRNIIWI